MCIKTVIIIIVFVSCAYSRIGLVRDTAKSETLISTNLSHKNLPDSIATWSDSLLTWTSKDSMPPPPYCKDIYDPTGYNYSETHDDSLKFRPSDRYVKVAGTHEIYFKGRKYTKTNDSIQIPATTGNWIVYYDSTMTMQVTQDLQPYYLPWVAYVYWNNTQGIGICGDERHRAVMPWKSHEEFHQTVGAYWQTGLALTAGNTSFLLDAGAIKDEDITHQHGAQTSCNLFYYDGSATFTIDTGNTTLYKGTVGSLYYNDGTTLTAAPVNSYMAVFLFGTNDINGRPVSVIGRRTDVLLADAEENNTLSSLALSGFPINEYVLLYIVFYCNDATPFEKAVDYRSSSVSTGGGGSETNDHSLLSNLGYSASGHTGFATGTSGKADSAFISDSVKNLGSNVGDNGYIQKALNGKLVNSTIYEPASDAVTIDANLSSKRIILNAGAGYQPALYTNNTDSNATMLGIIHSDRDVIFTNYMGRLIFSDSILATGDMYYLASPRISPLTSNRVVYSDASDRLTSSSVTATTLSYLDIGSSLTGLLALKLNISDTSVFARDNDLALKLNISDTSAFARDADVALKLNISDTSLFLHKTGGTMTGNIAMGSNYINNTGTASKGLTFNGVDIAYVTNTPDIHGDLRGSLYLTDDNSYGQGVSGGIIMRGKYTESGNFANLAGISGYKANAISGNYEGYLDLIARANGANPTTELRIQVGEIRMFDQYLNNTGTASKGLTFNASDNAIFTEGITVNDSIINAKLTAHLNLLLKRSSYDSAFNANIGSDSYHQMASGNKLVNSNIATIGSEAIVYGDLLVTSTTDFNTAEFATQGLYANRLKMNTGHTSYGNAKANSIEFLESGTFRAGIGVPTSGTYDRALCLTAGSAMDETPEAFVKNGVFGLGSTVVSNTGSTTDGVKFDGSNYLTLYNGSSGGSKDSRARLTLEDNISLALQFLSPSTTEQSILFGSNLDTDDGAIRYNLYDHKFTFRIKGTDGIIINYNNEMGLNGNYINNNGTSDKGMHFDNNHKGYFTDGLDVTKKARIDSVDVNYAYSNTISTDSIYASKITISEVSSPCTLYNTGAGVKDIDVAYKQEIGNFVKVYLPYMLGPTTNDSAYIKFDANFLPIQSGNTNMSVMAGQDTAGLCNVYAYMYSTQRNRIHLKWKSGSITAGSTYLFGGVFEYRKN